LGDDSLLKFFGAPKPPNVDSISVNFCNLPVHCSGTEQHIANLKWIIKLETFFYQTVKEWYTLVHYKICDCGSFASTLWAEVFRLDEAALS